MKDVEILEYSIEEPFGVEGEECYERLSWILLPEVWKNPKWNTSCKIHTPYLQFLCIIKNRKNDILL
ncbi:hypothetical protein L3K75_12350 [[Ruminococcus] lactaris]|jgi:hypothetical protein|nr:hypothetical protein [[Ruminococcus] lactaris]